MNEILTAQTDRGRAALEELLAHFPEADLGGVPPEWTRVLIADGTAASFIAVDPNCAIEYPRGEVGYALLREGATHESVRGRGYFRVLLEDTIQALREAGCPWVFSRMPMGVGQALGFAVFTNYSSFLLRPEEIEQTLGGGRPDLAESLISIVEAPELQEDLLLVSEVRASSEFECVQALREAAWVARSKGKMRIMFEHPPAALPGSRYAIHSCRQTTLTSVAMTCHGRIRIIGADEGDEEEKLDQSGAADMVRLIDLPKAVSQVLEAGGVLSNGCPRGAVALDTNAGKATITVGETSWRVSEGIAPGAEVAPFTSEIVAQMLTGYRSAKTQCYLYETQIAKEPAEILDRLFPRFWRFSRNERWVSRRWAERATLQAWE